MLLNQILKPKVSGSSPDDSEAAASFKYWLTTCEIFLRTVEAGQAASNPGVEVNKKTTAC